MPGFEKADNGLFKIKTHTTRQGLVFISFDTSPDTTNFVEFYKGLEDECDEVKFEDFEYVESWRQEGDFNWKTLSICSPPPFPFSVI